MRKLCSAQMHSHLNSIVVIVGENEVLFVCLHNSTCTSISKQICDLFSMNQLMLVLKKKSDHSFLAFKHNVVKIVYFSQRGCESIYMVVFGK